MVEEGIRGGICHTIHRHAKANNKYMKNYDKNEESSYIQYLDVNNLYGWAMSQKLPLNGFKWINDVSEMPNEDNKIIKYNQGEKSIKSPFIIYADLECLLEKTSTRYKYLEESSTTEINKHTPSGYPLFTHCSFDKTKNKLDYYRGEDCMKKFCLDLREHAKKKKKKMIPLTKKEEKNPNKQKVCYICKKEFNTDDSDKKHHKVKDHCHYTGKYRHVSEIDEKFIQNYDEDNHKGYIPEVDVKYPRKLHDLHSDLPFLLKIMKID